MEISPEPRPGEITRAKFAVPAGAVNVDNIRQNQWLLKFQDRFHKMFFRKLRRQFQSNHHAFFANYVRLQKATRAVSAMLFHAIVPDLLWQF